MRAGFGERGRETGLGDGDGKRKRDLGTGTGAEPVEVTVVSTRSAVGNGESEQRYSGKPDGLPERPKLIYNVKFIIHN